MNAADALALEPVVHVALTPREARALHYSADQALERLRDRGRHAGDSMVASADRVLIHAIRRAGVELDV